MNNSKLLRFSIRLANSFFSTHCSGIARLGLTQVTRYSQFSQFNPTSFPPKSFISNNYPFNFRQNVFFSSKPQSFIDVLLSNDWSNEIEKELEELTHEFVLYVLMNLNTNPRKSLDFFNWVCDKKGFHPSYWPCFILLRTLACREFMGDFCKLFSEMVRRGFYIDYRAYSTINIKLTSEKLKKESVEWTKLNKEMVENDGDKDVVNAVFVVISSFDWGEEVVSLLKKKLKFPLNENFLLRMIAELWKQPLKALKFFEWVGSYGGYEHDSVTYNAMAQVLASHKSVGEFWDFVKKMRLDGYEIDLYTYTRSARHLPIKDAVELFELMMDGPYPLSAHHATSLLATISHEPEPDMDLVYRVFNKFVAAGKSPTKSMYDIVHRAFCNLGKIDEAKKVVEEMRNFGYKPDNLTYSQEILGQCKLGRLDEACKVIDEMEVEGCVPNVKTWTILIEGYCVANRVDLALSCFAKMKERDVNMGPGTLLVLIRGFISQNKVLDAYTYFTELVKDECQLKPSQNTLRLLIEKLAEGGKLEEALDILGRMKKLHYRVFPHPITQYISKHGTVGDAKRLLEVLSPNVGSCVAVYTKVINSFIEQGRYLDAKDLVRSSPIHVRRDDAIRAMFDLDQASPMEEAPVRASS